MKTATDGKRKHRRQMSSAEIASVEALVHDQPRSSWALGPHLLSRMETKEVSREEVEETLAAGYFVEINENKDLCVVFRKDFPESSVCVVAALRTRWVVTTWRNRKGDRHTKLDTAKYQWNVDVRKVMAAFA
jgi:hypothetical protein